MDNAPNVIHELLSHLSIFLRGVDKLLSAVLGNPVVNWIAAPIAGIVIAGVLVRVPLVLPRRLAYQLWSTPTNAVALARVCFIRGRWFLKHNYRARALKHLNFAIHALSLSAETDEARALQRKCREIRALAYEQMERWADAAIDLKYLTQQPSQGIRSSDAAYLRRLAIAKDRLGMHNEARVLHQQAEYYEKSEEVPAAASAILQMWPKEQNLVVKPVRDSSELQDALADVKALVERDPTDANAMYAQALLELRAGDDCAISSLTSAAALLPPDFVNVYYWRARARATADDLRGCLEDCERASSSTALIGSVRYLEGFALFGLEQYADAIDKFLQATDAAPSMSEAYKGLVLARARLRQWEQTIAECDRASQRGIEDSSMYAARGEAELNLRRFDQALRDCSKALSLSSQSIYAYRVRGVTYLRLKKWTDAVHDLTSALKLDEKDAFSYAYRADANRMQGKITQAIEDADKAVSYAGDLEFARLVRAVITLRRWEIEQQEVLLECAERDGTWLVATAPASASGYWVQALIKQARGKADEAILLATQALKRDPRFAFAYQTRGSVHFSRSAWSKAAADFNLALTNGNPAELNVSQCGLAECQRMEGKIPLSIESYDKAIALAPDYVWAYYGRGWAYIAERNWTKAIESYTAAITRGLFVPEIYRARGWAHFDCRCDAEALNDFAEAFQIDPRPITTLMDWGFVLVVAGQADAGAEKFSDVLNLDPKSHEGFASRGWARCVAGDLEGALEDENKAVELNATIATNFNNRAWVLCKLERWDDANTDCGNAIELDKSLDYAFKNRSLARWHLDRPDEVLDDLKEMVRLRQSTGRAPAPTRGDRFNWEDQSRDWAKALASKQADAVGYLGWGTALWMSGQLGPAEEKIRRALVISPQLQAGLDCLAEIDKQRVQSSSA